MSYLWNDKIRGHRRDTPPNIMEDIASLVQTNPAQTTQVKYTGVLSRLVYESNFSVMDGQTNYTYQPGTPEGAIRKVDNARSEAFFAATREEHQPNSRTQFDNILSYSMSKGGDHLLKGGVQFGAALLRVGLLGARRPLRRVQQRRAGAGAPVQHPGDPKNIAHVLGFFLQDSWSMNTADAEPGRALRPLHRHHSPSSRAPADAVRRRPAACAETTQRARAEHLRVARRRVLRPVRQRLDRAQVQLQPLRAADRHRPGHRR